MARKLLLIAAVVGVVAVVAGFAGSRLHGASAGTADLNLLVSHKDTIYEYTQTGTLLGAIDVPYGVAERPATEHLRDIIVDQAGDILAFNTASIAVDSGSEVTITFSNPSSVNTHNFVVVQQGTKDAVATDGITAGPDNNWLPVNDSRVIASTVLIGPGETGQVIFTAPAPGVYQFVCTFPGHNFTMFGDFIVN